LPQRGLFAAGSAVDGRSPGSGFGSALDFQARVRRERHDRHAHPPDQARIRGVRAPGISKGAQNRSGCSNQLHQPELATLGRVYACEFEKDDRELRVHVEYRLVQPRISATTPAFATMADARRYRGARLAQPGGSEICCRKPGHPPITLSSPIDVGNWHTPAEPACPERFPVLGPDRNCYGGANLSQFDPMYGAAVRCKRFGRSVGLRSCIEVSGL
jgi:hypothetical protein